MNGFSAADMSTAAANGHAEGYQAGYADAVKAVEVGKPAAAQEAVAWYYGFADTGEAGPVTFGGNPGAEAIEWAERHGHTLHYLYAAPGPAAPVDLDALAVNRYRPVPDGLLAYKVVAGDGTRSLFSGTMNECNVVARKLTEAFLDGAHVAHAAAAPMFDYQDVLGSVAAAEAIRDAGELLRTPAATGIDLRNAILQLQEDALHMKDPGDTVNAYNRVLALIDASPNGCDAQDGARWRYVRRKLCLTGNGDGTCQMRAINLPAAIPGWPEPAEVESFCDAAIDAAMQATSAEVGE